MISEKEMARAKDIFEGNLKLLSVMLPEGYDLHLEVSTDRDELAGTSSVLIQVKDGEMVLADLYMDSKDGDVIPGITLYELAATRTRPVPPDEAKRLLNEYLAMAEALPGMEKKLQVILQDNEWPEE